MPNGYDAHSTGFARPGRTTVAEAAKKQAVAEANSTIDMMMLGMARRDNRARRQGGYRTPMTVAQEAEMFAQECDGDGFVNGFVLGRAAGGGHGDWDHEGPGPMREAKGDLPPWLQKDGDDSDNSSSGSRKGRRGRRGKVAESALNPQIRFRETVGWNGFEEAGQDNLPPWLRKDDEDDVEEADLNAQRRNKLPASDFALPGGRYPIPDAAHARNALSRVVQNGSPAEIARVRAAVRRKFPDIDVSGGKKS
jgi:hypothetical protein